MSKWKTIRKERLGEFAGYQNTRGMMAGIAAAWTGFALAEGDLILFVFALLALGVYGFYRYRNRNRFTRIEKAIDDAGGENQH